MIAKDLISSELAPLDPMDTGEQAITMMHIYHVKHLPVVDKEDNVLAVVSEDDILRNGMDKTIKSLEFTENKYRVFDTDHLFDVMAKVADKKYTTIPVIDQQLKFVGIISQEALLQHYTNNFSFKEPGSILVLEMKDTDYSLSEIARLVEGENAMILSSFLTQVPTSDQSMVTIKINKKDISSISATFERFDYTVKASFSEEEYIGNYKERYDSLMRYLNV